MLWPGTPDDALQIVDVRDLADFTIDCVDREISGTFNMVNEPGAYTMGRLLEDCEAVTATTVDAIWVAEDFVKAQGLDPGAQLPIWQGAGGAFGVSAARAVAAGMQMITRGRYGDGPEADLLGPEDEIPQLEAEVLAAWKAR